MERFFLLLVIISIRLAAYGDVQSQCQVLFDKGNKEIAMQNYAKSLEYFMEANTIARTNNLLIYQMKALNSMARIYREILDYEKAMECHLEAYRLAIKDPEKRYVKEEIRILNNISGLYNINKEYDKAKEYVRKAFETAMQLQDSLLAGGSATNLASFANRTEDLDEAERYLNLAEIMLKNQNKDPLLLLIKKAVRMENLYLRKEYNKAEQLALEVLDECITLSHNEFKVETLLSLSRIYQKKKEYQKAIKMCKEALNSNPKLNISADICEQMSKVYLDMDAPHLAIPYLDSVIVIKDSLAKLTNMNNIMINQVKFDLINSEKALAESKAKREAERTLFIFIMLFIIFSILILVLVFRIKFARNKHQKLLTDLELEKQKNEKLFLEQQLKEQEVLSLREQQRLHDEIDAKNRQLAAKILFQSSRNELIKEIINTLTKIPNQSEDLILKSAIRKLKEQINESTDWNGFFIYFEQLNPNFLSALKEKHPDLTANEIRLLSYMYLDLDTKEISKLFNITPIYFRKKKQLLSQKMKVPTTEMYRYLTSI